jgi:hypothetical protein
MSERLRQFVVDVSNDPDRAKRLTADPTAELEGSDLSPEERTVVLSRNPDALRDAIGMQPFDVLQMNSFFKEPLRTPGEPARRKKPRPRKPSRKPARKPPAKKPGRKKATPKRTSRKSARKTARKSTRKTARKPVRKAARKGSRGRRG